MAPPPKGGPFYIAGEELSVSVNPSRTSATAQPLIPRDVFATFSRRFRYAGRSGIRIFGAGGPCPVMGLA